MKYHLTEILQVEKWELNDFQVCFRHNFSNNTSRHVNYLNSSKFIAFLKEVTSHIKRADMEQQKDLDLHLPDNEKYAEFEAVYMSPKLAGTDGL